jgi:hypothetical protein
MQAIVVNCPTQSTEAQPSEYYSRRRVSSIYPVQRRIYFAGGTSTLRPGLSHHHIHIRISSHFLLVTLKSGLVPHSAAPEPCRSEQSYPPPSPPRRTTSRRGSKRSGIILPIPPRARAWVLGCRASRDYRRTGPPHRAMRSHRRMVRGRDWAEETWTVRTRGTVRSRARSKRPRSRKRKRSWKWCINRSRLMVRLLLGGTMLMDSHLEVHVEIISPRAGHHFTVGGSAHPAGHVCMVCRRDFLAPRPRANSAGHQTSASENQDRLILILSSSLRLPLGFSRLALSKLSASPCGSSSLGSPSPRRASPFGKSLFPLSVPPHC